MPRTAVFVLAATLVAALALPTARSAPAQAAAVAAPPAGETACAFGAFVAETDPAGLNVRAGPGTAHAVLGTLPPIRRSHDDPPIQAMVEVRVIAGREGWFKIADAQDNEALVEGPQRPMFKGTGWVSGRKLTVKSQAGIGRQRPDAKAPAVLIGHDGIVFDSDAFVASGRLAGCSGRWALVEYAPIERDGDGDAGLEVKPAAKAGLAGGRFRAWVDRICALQETSCDGG